MQKRIPFARNLLPEATDALGAPRQDFGPLQGPLDPTRATVNVAATDSLLRELVRLDLGLSGLKPQQGESAADFKVRTQQFGQLYRSYGAQLVSDPQYQQSDDRARREVLGALNRQLKRLLGDDDEGQAGSRLNSPALFQGVRRQQERKARKQREKQRGR
jgi:hypothetical protein